MYFDVIIIGAGPAGSSTAIHLCKQQQTVAIVSTVYPESNRVDVLHPDTREELGFLGLDRETIAGIGIPCHAIGASWGASAPRTHDFMFHPQGAGLFVDRSSFDMELLRRAQNTGAQLQYSAKYGVTSDGSHWRVSWTDGTNLNEARAKLLVDATGRAAAIARRMRVPRTVCDRLVGIGARIPNSSPSLLRVVTAEYGWWYSVPYRDETFLCLITDSDIARELNATDARAWSALARRCTSELAVSTTRVITFSCHSAVLLFMSDNWVAVGDAAASYDPLSAIGILHALRSSRHAANAITACVNGDANALRSYADQQRETFASYLGIRAQQYSLERRYPDHVFWRRRHASITSVPSTPTAHPPSQFHLHSVGE